MFPRFYPIIDAGVCGARGLDPTHVAEACLSGGARLLQLRSKSGGSAALVALADAAVALARPFGARVIINDRVDVAMMSRAAGVHVGQEDMTVADVRRVMGASAVVGLSTHTREQVDAALETSATYIAVGPIFGTRTKDTGYDARGLDLVGYAARRGKPVVAIGGITLENAPGVIAAGADAVAVITDVLAGNDPESRTRVYVAVLGEPRRALQNPNPAEP